MQLPHHHLIEILQHHLNTLQDIDLILAHLEGRGMGANAVVEACRERLVEMGEKQPYYLKKPAVVSDKACREHAENVVELHNMQEHLQHACRKFMHLYGSNTALRSYEKMLSEVWSRSGMASYVEQAVAQALPLYNDNQFISSVLHYVEEQSVLPVKAGVSQCLAY